MALPTDITPNDIRHVEIHNEVNTEVNRLTTAVGSPTAAATANQIVKRDAAGRAKVAAPAADTDISTKKYVDDAIKANTSKQADLIAATPTPWVIGHRSGKWHYPEESVEAVQAMIDQGWIPEVDLWPLKDGTLVCIHDSTVQRTMTGTGAVNTFTLAQWKSMKVLPAVPGGATGTPLTFEEYLQRWGGTALLCAEVKDAAQATVVGDLVVKYGLEKAIWLQSFNLPTVRALVARGLTCTYLFGATWDASVTPASLKAEGILYVSPQDTITSANRKALVDAGLRVVPWNYNTKALADAAKAAGIWGYFSDDPFKSEGRPAWSAVDPWRDGLPGGLLTGRGSAVSTASIVFPAKSVRLGGGGVMWTGLKAADRPADASSAAAIALVSLDNSPIIDTTKDLHISFDVTWGPFADTGESSTANATGIYLYRNTVDPDAEFLDGVVSGQEGWMIGLRRNGQINVWKYVGGAAGAAVITNPATTPATSLLESGGVAVTRVSFVVRADGPAVRLQSTVNNNYGASGDTYRPGACKIGLRFPAASEGVISNLSISGTFL